MSVNKAIIVGNLGRDPEPIAQGKGCAFSVATSERWKDKSGQQQERTEWHRIVVWGNQADACMRYLAKGRQVYVEGSIQTDEYQADDGSTRKSTQIKAQRVQFLQGGSDSGPSRPSPGNSYASMSDDIPF